MYDELQKCWLLQGDCDDRLLRGLLAMWQGAIDMENGVPEFVSVPFKVKRNPGLAKAFPENLLSLLPPPDRIRFAKIDEQSTTPMTIGNDTGIPLAVLDGTTITFIFSATGERMNLSSEPKPKKKATATTRDSELRESTPSQNAQAQDLTVRLGESTPSKNAETLKSTVAD